MVSAVVADTTQAGHWTVDDEQYLVDTYAFQTVREQAGALGRSYTSVVTKRAQLIRQGRINPRTRPYHPRWTDEEVERLRSLYSRFDLPTLARRFGRSTTGVHLKAKRLGLTKIDDWYTAQELARLFGIRCAKSVVRWVSKGFLRGGHVQWRYGPNHPWAFEHDDVVVFIEAHPWLLELRRMERHYFRSVLQAQWDLDPWYEPKEAARRLGVCKETMARYLRSGRVKGHRSGDGKWGYWKVRQSALAGLALRPRGRRSVGGLRPAARGSGRGME